MSERKQDLDDRILRLLKEDSRRSNVSIAGEIDVSEGLIRQRIARMRENGTIRKFTIETMSRGLKAVIEVNIEVNVHTTDIARSIRDLPGVERVFETSGVTDIIAILDVEDTSRLNDTIEAIRALGPITNTRTKLVLGEL
ncbi:MAG: Lrp/AsnC family transcriptional regulator [Thermoplasmatota archaeon]